MTEFYVGQRVICVEGGDDGRFGFGDEQYPVTNAIYTIRTLVTRQYGGPGRVLLEEIVNPPRPYIDGEHEFAFRPDRFRPLEEKPDSLAWVRKILADARDGKLTEIATPRATPARTREREVEGRRTTPIPTDSSAPPVFRSMGGRS